VSQLPENFSDVVERWTVLESEVDLLAGKHGATRPGFVRCVVWVGAVSGRAIHAVPSTRRGF
jgi:hypothetical protein